MKKILLTLLVALGLASPVLALNTAIVTTTTTGAGTLFSTGNPNVTAVTYTAGATIPQGSLLKKLIVAPVTAGTASSFSLWDCPRGLTYASGARQILPTVNFGTGQAPAFQVFDFTATAGNMGAPPNDGLYFKYFPVFVNAGTNTINATAIYEPFTGALQVPRP